LDLSIVIPAYEEAHKIERDVTSASAFLADAHLRGEVIVVDDGSRDDTAQAARNADLGPGVELNVIRYEHNRGKGYAVRTGIKATTGDIVMFADSGYCVPFGAAVRGMEMIRSNVCDIAHGSRKLPESIITQHQRWHRRVLSRMFRWFVRAFVGVPRRFTDTQCGFKLYRGHIARELFGETISDGFMFDIEVLLRALRKGYTVVEFPVEWSSDHDTRLRAVHASWRSLLELIAIKRALNSR